MTLAAAVALRLLLEQHRDSAEQPSAALALVRRAEQAARAALRAIPVLAEVKP